jgi:hypothetical protein
MYWIDLALNRDGWHVVVNIVINLWIPLNSVNFFNILCPLRFSGRTLPYGVSWLQEFVWESFFLTFVPTTLYK